MTYGCKIMVSLTLCGFFGPPCTEKFIVYFTCILCSLRAIRGEGSVWLIGTVVCLLAANRGSNCSFTRAMDGRIVLCGIISSSQSAVTSEIVKALWPRVRLV